MFNLVDVPPRVLKRSVNLSMVGTYEAITMTLLRVQPEV